MQVKTLLKAILPLFLLAILLQGCDTTDSSGDGNGQPQFPLNTSSLPILQMNNWWAYMDGEGHHLSIRVIDTITDNKVKYFETVFSQEGIDTVDDWFIQNSSGTEYATNLLGPYRLFLPLQLNSEAGTFMSDSTQVNYTYSDSATLGGTPFRYVIQLSYSQPVVYHGVNVLDVADSIGIVQLVYNGGLFPDTYQLDSAFVGGKVTRY